MAKSPTKVPSPTLERNKSEAEDALVLGDFRRALKLANECLLQAETTSTTTVGIAPTSCSAEDTLVLHTPLHLFSNASLLESSRDGCHHHHHYLCVHFSAVKDPLERFVAVALQSWYELYTRCDKQRPVLLRQGVRNLEPLLSLYTTTTRKTPPTNDDLVERHQRSMSMELVWLFLQFCHATRHYEFAINAALEVLHHTLYNLDLKQQKNDDHGNGDTWQHAALCEMLQVLLQEWLVCAPKHQVVKALHILFGSAREWTFTNNGTVMKWNQTEETQPDSIQCIVNELNREDRIDSVPSWATETLRECKIFLQSTLLQDNKNTSALTNTAHGDLQSAWNTEKLSSENETETMNEDPSRLALSLSRTPRRIAKSLRLLLSYIHFKLKEAIRVYKDNDEDAHAHYNRMAIAVLISFSVTWFQRRRIKRILVEFISRLFLVRSTMVKPIAGILHAMILPSGSH